MRTGCRRAGIAAAAALSLALAGCSAIEFYWQGFAGQLDLLARARPIPEVAASTSDPVLRAKLERAQEMRTFASRELALPDNGSYTRYADLGRPFVVWNVFAAPELSLSPRQWCFPIAGCVAYRGYFAEEEARAEGARLAAEGYDVYVAGVPAYSTLGYFDDPVLSTFIRARDTEVARLIFHELAHQVVYVKDDSSFNESFAVEVEEEGLARWSAAHPGATQFAQDVARMRRLRADFRALIHGTRDRLAALYASDLTDAEKRAAESGDLRRHARRVRAGQGGLGRRAGVRPLVRERRQQRRYRCRGPLCRPRAAVRGASRGRRRQPAALLRAGPRTGGAAEDGT